MLSLEYGYDNKGNITDIFNYIDAAKAQSFVYDSLDRLASAQSTAHGTLTYAYDQIGNFQTKEGIVYTPDAIRPHAVGATSDGRSYSYDANGNMTADGQRVIAWDYDNRPTSITYGDTTSFVYDGAGSRVKKTGPAGTLVYIDKLYECSGGVCAKYIFANGQRIALKSPTYTLYYHQDHLGSTGVVTDAQGNKVEDIFYKPFGESLLDSGAFSLNHKYTGQEFDPETGLYYYNARYYSPRLGRFISADTVVSDPTNPQSFNRFSYVLNNPLKFTDPSGYGEYDEYFWLDYGGGDSYSGDWNLNTYLNEQDSFDSWLNGNSSQASRSASYSSNMSSSHVGSVYYGASASQAFNYSPTEIRKLSGGYFEIGDSIFSASGNKIDGGDMGTLLQPDDLILLKGAIKAPFLLGRAGLGIAGSWGGRSLLYDASKAAFKAAKDIGTWTPKNKRNYSADQRKKFLTRFF